MPTKKRSKRTESGEGSSKGKGKGEAPSTKIIPARFLHENFFRTYCSDIMNIVTFYQLTTITSCRTTINLDLVAEFYVHLHCVRKEPLLYRTRVAKKDLDFSPVIWRNFLGTRPANNNFVCFPTLDEPLDEPFHDVTVDIMFDRFYHRPRPLQTYSFSSQGLSASDNILFKVIIGCILPLVTRGQAYVRLSHLFLMYAFRQRLEVDVALQMFHCILHFMVPSQQRVHMPFPHLITAWLASVGIDVARDRANLKPLTEYDGIGLRNFSLAGMMKAYRSMEWRPGHDFHLDELGPMEVEIAEGAEAAEGNQVDAAAEAPDVPAAEETDEEGLVDMAAYLDTSFESIDTRIEELRQEMTSGFASMDIRFDRLTSLVERYMIGPPPPPTSASEPPASDALPPMNLD